MKIIRGFIALFVSLCFASHGLAQTTSTYFQPASIRSESQGDRQYYDSSSTPTEQRQDEDDNGSTEDDDEEVILDEEALSEQLKQLRQHDEEIRAILEGYERNFETLRGFGASLEQQGGLIEELDDSLGGLVNHGHGSPKMVLLGRIHVDYWAFPNVENSVFPLEPGNPQDRFNFRRMRFGVEGDIRDNMFYKIEMEFAGGNSPSYRDVFLGWKHLPLFNTVKIGNQKRPYGLDHWNSSRYNVFIERPVVIESFNRDNRRMGISSWGHSEDLRSNWQYGVYNHRLTQSTDGYIGDHYQPEFASRFAYMPWYDDCSGGRGYMHFALSSSIAFPDGRGGLNNDSRYRSRPEARSSGTWWDTGRIVNANKSTLVGFEGVFNAGPLQLVGEYQYVSVDRTGIATSIQLHGGYIYASYFLTGEHIPWDRKTGQLGRVKPFENFWRVRDCDGVTQSGLGAWQVAARLSHADLTDEDIIGGDGTALTLGLNWHWNAHARMQFNYIIGDVKRDPIGSGDYQVFGTRFMIDF